MKGFILPSFFFPCAHPFFTLFHVSDPYYFPSLYRTTWSISWKASLPATDSLSFCLSEKAFISPSVVKGNFTGYRILNLWVFSLSTLNTSLHSWGVGSNPYLCSSIDDMLFPRSGFFYDFCSLFPLFCSLKMKCLGVILGSIHPVWCSVRFLDLRFCVWR